MNKSNKKSKIPPYSKLCIPTLKALKELGGSGTNEEINEKVYIILNLNDDTLNIPHNENGLVSEIDYRLAWARTYLKKYGLIENSSRAVWALIDNELEISKIKSEDIIEGVRQIFKGKKKSSLNTQPDEEYSLESQENSIWKDELINILQDIKPDAFERLCQRLLRESGFIQVEVTGKSSDGGIDGKGIVRINGFLSFHVIFQSKRYKGSVGSAQIRDFRGAMQGRADKGIFITTGNFTREAIKEATSDGVPPIEMIDGELICEKLKELRLGVGTELIEEVSIDSNWFYKL